MPTLVLNGWQKNAKRVGKGLQYSAKRVGKRCQSYLLASYWHHVWHGNNTVTTLFWHRWKYSTEISLSFVRAWWNLCTELYTDHQTNLLIYLITYWFPRYVLNFILFNLVYWTTYWSSHFCTELHTDHQTYVLDYILITKLLYWITHWS